MKVTAVPGRFQSEVLDFGVEGAAYGDLELHRQWIWIAWERQRRTTELARSMGIRLFRLLFSGPRLLRYLVLSVQTIEILLKNRPKVVFVQNPSVFLALIAGLLKPLFRYRLVVDRHTNFALNSPNSFRKRSFTMISDWTLRLADLTIVTNRPLAELVESKQGRAFVLPDKLPTDFPSESKTDLPGERNICFICTYAKDEPYNEVVMACASLPTDTYLLVTGKKSRAHFTEETLRLLGSSKHIVLTDYISEEEYIRLITSVDVVIDLTTLDYCLVCGAYEAIAAGKALILSNTQVNRELFGDVPILVDADRDSIRDGVDQILEELAVRTDRIACLRTDYFRYWDESFLNLVQNLESYNGI